MYELPGLMTGWAALLMLPRENTPLHELAIDCNCGAYERARAMWNDDPRIDVRFVSSASPIHRSFCVSMREAQRVVRHRMAEQPDTPKGNERRSLLGRLLERMT